MRFRWTYLDLVGGFLALFGILAVTPLCPFVVFFPPIPYGEPCDPVSGAVGKVGFALALAGAALIVAAEIGRRSRPRPKAAVA